jgi:cytidylate kinase
MAILTISREIGTDGLQVGKVVAEKMGYTFLDKEGVLQEMAKEGSDWVRTAEELDEHMPSFWDRFDQKYWGFIALAQSHLLDCALAGNVVIIGRGSNFLLEDIPYALKVRIIAPMEIRLRSVSEDQTNADFISANKEAALKILEKSDKESEQLMHYIFGRHWNDPRAYDITLNMSSLSTDEVTEILIAMLSHKDRHINSAAQEQLRKHALAARIKASIVTNTHVHVPTLEVLPVGSTMVIRGVVHSAKEHKVVEEEAKKIAGDVPVKCELHYR